MRTNHRELLLQAYVAYNDRDVEALLALVSDGVDWPDDMGQLHGKEEVRVYWTEQWARTLTHDEPAGFSELNDGRTPVQITQVVREPPVTAPGCRRSRSCARRARQPARGELPDTTATGIRAIAWSRTCFLLPTGRGDPMANEPRRSSWSTGSVRAMLTDAGLKSPTTSISRPWHGSCTCGHATLGTSVSLSPTHPPADDTDTS